MEKDFRLFVRNLPLNADESWVEKLFAKYVTVNKIDLKEKKDIDDKINKFAFVNVTTTDKKLNTCFSQLNGERIDGYEIYVELAKESFLERLKRERSESNQKKEKPKVNPEFSKPDSLYSVHTKSKPKRKTFSDTDFESSEFLVKESDKELENVEDYENIESYVPEPSNLREKFYKKSYSKSNDFFTSKKQNFYDEEYSNGLEEDVKTNKKLKNIKINKSTEANNNIINSNISENSVVNESDRKRLMSLQQKKQIFKAQEQTIRNALRFVDNKKPNKKIVFDDNIDIENSEEKTKKSSNKKNVLFGSDDEGQEDFQWNEDELDIKANIKQKLLKLQTKIGNDKRFALDERFIDDEDKNDKNDKKDEIHVEESNEIDEKKWQLNILGDVLGKPIATLTTDNNDATKIKNRMIRYDPSASNHKDYEVTVEKTKREKPVKKKRKLSIENKEENAVPVVSKEIFYDVSEKLVESLQENEGFSLLKSLGRDTSNTDNKNKPENEAKENGESFKFNFSAKNPFKYDSSDDDDGNEEENEKNNLTNSNMIEYKRPRQEESRLFFTYNEINFQEAKNFFNSKLTQEEDAFKNRRQELKRIVRSKIRNNLKKTVPWNRKKVRKIQKKFLK